GPDEQGIRVPAHDERAPIDAEGAELLLHGLRLAVRGQVVHDDQRPAGGMAAECRAEGEPPHGTRKVLGEAARPGPVGDATADMVGRANRALAGAAEALLAPDLGAGAADFAARLGRSGASAAVRHLRDVGLVQHGAVRLDTEHFVGDFDLAKLRALCVNYCKLHFATLWETFRAWRTRTSPPLGPGTEPATKMIPRSSFRATTSRLRMVVRTAPM